VRKTFVMNLMFQLHYFAACSTKIFSSACGIFTPLALFTPDFDVAPFLMFIRFDHMDPLSYLFLIISILVNQELVHLYFKDIAEPKQVNKYARESFEISILTFKK
jgi:hypothetical protein